MSTAPTKSGRARAADRIAINYAVPILTPPTTGDTIRVKPSGRPSTSAERRQKQRQAALGAVPVRPWVAELKFDPGQPRDNEGKWTDGTPSGGVGIDGSTVITPEMLTPSGSGNTLSPAEQDELNDRNARDIARRWTASQEDKDALMRATGPWFESEGQHLPPEERNEFFVRHELVKSRSGIGPISIAGAAAVADRLGIAYDLGEIRSGQVEYMRARPELDRATRALGEAMYANTQDWLRERGIGSVDLFRLRGLYDDKALVTSWAIREGATFNAPEHHGGRELLHEAIPADRVFSLAATGLGALEEEEFLVFNANRTGNGNGAAATRAESAVRPQVLAIVRDELARLHLPGEHRQKDHAGDGAPGIDLKLDKLKLAGRIKLDDGEELVSSGKIDTDNGSARVAVTRRNGEPSVRIAAELSDGGLPKWSGNEPRTAAIKAERQRIKAERDQLDEDDPRHEELAAKLEQLGEEDWNTARLDAAGSEELRNRLGHALAAATEVEKAETRRWAEVDRLNAERDKLRGMGRKWTDEEEGRWDSLTEQIETLTSGATEFDEEGTVSGEWGDVHFRVYFETVDSGTTAVIGVKPHGVEPDWEQTRDWKGVFDAAETRKILKLIGGSTADNLSAAPARPNNVRSWVAAIVRDELAQLHQPGRHRQKDHGNGNGKKDFKNAARELFALAAAPPRARVLMEASLTPEKRRAFLEKLETLSPAQVDKLGGTGRRAVIGDSDVLSAEERSSITRTIASYMTDGYKPINRALHRAAGGPLADEVTPEVRQAIQDLDRLLEMSVIDRDVVIFRGTKFEGEPPDELISPAFSSATASEQVARDFALGEFLGQVTGSTHRPGTPTVLEIRVPKGTHGVQLSEYAVAAEVLFRRGERLVKVSDEGITSGVRRVVYEVRGRDA